MFAVIHDSNLTPAYTVESQVERQCSALTFRKDVCSTMSLHINAELGGALPPPPPPPPPPRARAESRKVGAAPAAAARQQRGATPALLPVAVAPPSQFAPLPPLTAAAPAAGVARADSQRIRRSGGCRT